MNDIKMGNIEISGLRDLEEKMKGLSDKLAKKILSEAIKEGAKVIQKETRNNIKDSDGPHKLKVKGQYITIMPGNLRKSIGVKLDKSKSRGYAITYEVFSKRAKAWYFKFYELGTSKMAARSPMRRAFESQKEMAVEAIKRYVEEHLGY